MARRALLCTLLGSLSLTGCGTGVAVLPDAGSAPPDAGPADAGAVDAGPVDAGPADAGGPVDAGPEDAGPVDAGAPEDAGPTDAGQPEDAGAEDAGQPVDAGSPADAGPPDSGPEDAGPGPGSDGGVDPADVTLVPPGTAGRVVLATVTGYEMSVACEGMTSQANCEIPLYTPYDRNDPAWWNDLVEELAFSRIQLTLLHGRGCYDPLTGDSGNGNMCPRLLRNFVSAVYAQGLQDVIRVGMFDDTGAYPGTRNTVDGLPDGTPFDLADPTAWRFFWDHNMKVWFDTVPDALLYKVNGRPVVAFWSLASAFFSHQQGNASALLDWLRQQMLATYGLDPLFIVDGTWIDLDSTITPAQAQGRNDWFDPNQNTYTVNAWGGAQWGAMVPGYRNPDNPPGCGAACREQVRGEGTALRHGLAGNRQSQIALIEGFTNVIESAGLYRSDAWSRPNLYLDVTREAVDFETETLRYEAEAADAYQDNSPGNAGGSYRLGGDLDIAPLPGGTGWSVGWTEPGEWLEYRDVHLACGTYRFTARASASDPNARLHLEVDGQPQAPVAVGGAGDPADYRLVPLAELSLPEGRHTLRIAFDDAGVNLDWFFHHKRDHACSQARPLLVRDACPAGLDDRGSFPAPTYAPDITASDFLDRPAAGGPMHFCHQGSGLVLAANTCPAGLTAVSSLQPAPGDSFVDSAGAAHGYPSRLELCAAPGLGAHLRLGSCPAGETQTGLVYAPRSSTGDTVVDDTGTSAQGAWTALCAP